MTSLTSSALSALVPLLLLFLTPVGACLVLASPFWTVGMDVVFYFVEHQYSGKVVAVVSAVVALLFVVIVLSISIILLWQEGRQGDEAVFTGHRVKDASVGKYGGEFTETRYNANVAPYIARAFASVSGASPNHGHDEYSFLVGGSRNPSLVKLENCEPSADSSSDESCMPEAKGEACNKHIKVQVGTEVVSFSSAVPRFTGVPDGTFVTSVAKVASMTGTVDAPSVGSGCLAYVNPLGETFSSAFAAIDFGADKSVATALCRRDADGMAVTCDGDAKIGTVDGAFDVRAGSAGALISGAASSDANVDDAPASGALVSGVAFGESTSVSLSRSVVAASSLSTTFGGIKRMMRDDDDAFCARMEQAKKRKVISPLHDGMLLLAARLEICGIAATIAVNAALAHAGMFGADAFCSGPLSAGAFGAFNAFGAGAALRAGASGLSGSTLVGAADAGYIPMVNDPMDICESSSPSSPIPMDVGCSSVLESGDMDMTDNSPFASAVAVNTAVFRLSPAAWQPSAVLPVSAGGMLFSLPAAPTTTFAAIASTQSTAITATTIKIPNVDNATATANTTRRCIARLHGPLSTFGRRMGSHIAQGQQQQQPQVGTTTPTATTATAAITTVTEAENVQSDLPVSSGSITAAGLVDLLTRPIPTTTAATATATSTTTSTESTTAATKTATRIIAVPRAPSTGRRIAAPTLHNASSAATTKTTRSPTTATATFATTTYETADQESEEGFDLTTEEFDRLLDELDDEDDEDD